MAPIQNQNPAFSGLIIMVVVLGGLLTLAILPFLLTAIYIYLEEIWFFMIRDPKYYREWNRGRKEWNKASAIERRHRYIMSGLLDRLVDKQGLSEADRFRYAALIQTVYFPARAPIPHRLKMSLNGLTSKVQYMLFKNGYHANLTLKPEEWNEARARGMGRPGSAIAFFAPILGDTSQHASSISTVNTSGSRPRSGGGTGELMQSIAPPPYTEYSPTHLLQH